jgi:hypothetical protein
MKKTALLASLVAAGALAMPTNLTAHHSVQNEFDVNQVVVKTGILRKIDWINPHAWFHFEEIDANGQIVRNENGVPIVWSLETTGPNGLRNLGLADRRVFVVGAPFAFSGYPHRTGATKMFTLQIKFPDDRLVTMGFPENAPDLSLVPIPKPAPAA